MCQQGMYATLKDTSSHYVTLRSLLSSSHLYQFLPHAFGLILLPIFYFLHIVTGHGECTILASSLQNDEHVQLCLVHELEFTLSSLDLTTSVPTRTQSSFQHRPTITRCHTRVASPITSRLVISEP